jgi:hypothetical protein
VLGQYLCRTLADLSVMNSLGKMRLESAKAIPEHGMALLKSIRRLGGARAYYQPRQ